MGLARDEQQPEVVVEREHELAVHEAAAAAVVGAHVERTVRIDEHTRKLLPEGGVHTARREVHRRAEVARAMHLACIAAVGAVGGKDTPWRGDGA